MHHSICNRDWRNLKYVDAKDSVKTCLFTRVKPSAWVRQIQVHGIGNIVITIFGREFPDVVKDLPILIRRMKVQVPKMGGKEVDMHATAAGHLQNPSSIFRKLLFKDPQNRIFVAVACPSNILTQRMGIQRWLDVGHDNLLIDSCRW